MCAFINVSAVEKARELQLKTIHDANLESSMLVHEAKTKLNAGQKEEEKKIAMMERIRVSRAKAELRIKAMRVREELLDNTRAESIKRLQLATADKTKYASMLTDLIVQGLIKLNEPKVVVLCRAVDETICKSVLAAASQKYVDIIKKETGQTCQCALELNPGGKALPPPADGSGKKSCAGGVQLLAGGGKIVCDNTLDARLSTAFEQLMPEIRRTLFSQRL
jgi:V-type H+-transporting ATPase subunit E